MIVWVLTDDRVGSNNQSIAIAERLSDYYIIKKILYNSFIGLPNFIRGSSLIGVDKINSSNILDELPDVVICAGRRLSSVALNIKKRNRNRTFIINLMNPNLSYEKFDLLLLPKHDNTPQKFIDMGNVVETNGGLNGINEAKIEAEIEKWSKFFIGYKRPIVSLIIGGDTKNYKYNPNDFGHMITKVSDIVNGISGTLLITTSRRTSKECLNKIRQKVTCDYYLYDWKWENDSRNLTRNNLGNPYYSLLGLSNYLIVTGDSISMISESCATGNPIYLYMPKHTLSKKHYRFCELMVEQGYTRELNENTVKFEDYNYKPLNELDRVVNIICEKLK